MDASSRNSRSSGRADGVATFRGSAVGSKRLVVSVPGWYIFAMNRMQTVCLILCSSGFAAGLRAEIRTGETKDKVIAELGEPNGTFMQGDRDVLLYPNGTIEFRDGKALKIALVDPAEIAARDAAKAEAQRIEDEARQATIREGEEKIRLILETERFKNMSPAERVRTFDRIRRLHPGTPMPMEYETARDALAEKARTAGAESAVSDKEKRLQELKDAQSKLSSAKRRRFNRTHSDEMKALEKELAKP